MSDLLRERAAKVCGCALCVDKTWTWSCPKRDIIEQAIHAVIQECIDRIGSCPMGRPPMDEREMGPLGGLRKMFQDALREYYGLEKPT
jgi:hypothetical protein